MAKLSSQQIYNLARSVGLNPAQATIATAIALAESGGDTTIFSKPNADGSIDRGLWQINNKAHPEVSNGCAIDPLCNARAMASISNNGTTWRWWSTYNNGAYKNFLSQSQSITPIQQSLQGSQPVQKGNGFFDTFTYTLVLLLLGTTCIIGGIVIVFHPDIGKAIAKGAELALA